MATNKEVIEFIGNPDAMTLEEKETWLKTPWPPSMAISHSDLCGKLVKYMKIMIHAERHRLGGRIRVAIEHEMHADKVYKTLPRWVRW